MPNILERYKSNLVQLIERPDTINSLFYLQDGDSKTQMSGDKFIQELAKRLYIEGNFKEKIKTYEQEGRRTTTGPLTAKEFFEFISTETHYNLVDNHQYTWNENMMKFTSSEGKFLSFEEYHNLRERVIGALVKKAINIFTEEKTKPESKGKQQLFFASLADYLNSD